MKLIFKTKTIKSLIHKGFIRDFNLKKDWTRTLEVIFIYHNLDDFPRQLLENVVVKNEIKSRKLVEFKLMFKVFSPGCNGNKTICPTHILQYLKLWSWWQTSKSKQNHNWTFHWFFNIVFNLKFWLPW